MARSPRNTRPAINSRDRDLALVPASVRGRRKTSFRAYSMSFRAQSRNLFKMVIPSAACPEHRRRVEESTQKQPSILYFSSPPLTFRPAFAIITLCVWTYKENTKMIKQRIFDNRPYNRPRTGSETDKPLGCARGDARPVISTGAMSSIAQWRNLFRQLYIPIHSTTRPPEIR